MAASTPSSGATGAASVASAGMDILAGLFSYMNGRNAQAMMDSRARMIRDEAEVDAQLYSEQAEGFKAKQKLAFLKSGVQLTGSPLDILDETARTARENISAIRARGRSDEFDAQMAGLEAAQQGRAALIGGGFSAAKTSLMGMYSINRNAKTATTPRNNTNASMGGSRAER